MGKKIEEYGDVRAKPVRPLVGTYRQKFADPMALKLAIRAGTETSTIPDVVANDLDEISDDYNYADEHDEYYYNIVPRLKKHGIKNMHNPSTLKQAIKAAPTQYLDPNKIHTVSNATDLRDGHPQWHNYDKSDKLAVARSTTWGYKKDYWNDKYGDKGREEFDKYFDSLVNHIDSGKNADPKNMFPSVIINSGEWNRDDDVDHSSYSQHLLGGNTRLMIHQALDKGVPYRQISHVPSINEATFRLVDVRYRGKLLHEENTKKTQKEKSLMQYKLPALPYDFDALEPHISEATLREHHGKHHGGYIKKLNAMLTKESSLASKGLVDLIKTTHDEKKTKIFNNAAQHWNHAFLWNCMSPEGGGNPPRDLMKAITDSFGSMKEFKEDWIQASLDNFGSGWIWLVQKDGSNKLTIGMSKNAANPLTRGYKPILVMDVWEHAYYLDYKSNREKYTKNFFNVINWDFCSKMHRGETFTNF